MAAISPLRRRMIEDMTVRNLSPATQQSYINAVSKFSRYFGCVPDQLGLEDVRASRCIWSGRSARGRAEPGRVRAAVLLRRHTGPRRRSNASSVATSRASCRSCSAPTRSCASWKRFRAAQSRRADDRLCGGVARSGGGSPQGGIIDSERMLIQVEQGKGGKGPLRDAVAAAPEDSARLLEAGAAQAWFFPAGTPERHARTIHRCRAARRRARLGKPVTSTRFGTASRPIFWSAAPISGSSRSCSAMPASRDDRALHPGRDQTDRRHAQPTRSARAGGDAARLSRVRCARAWRWRTSSAATAKPFVPHMPAISAAISAG